VEKDLEQYSLVLLHHLWVNRLPANTKASEIDDKESHQDPEGRMDSWTGTGKE
jgi:hypothetical protein